MCVSLLAAPSSIWNMGLSELQTRIHSGPLDAVTWLLEGSSDGTCPELLSLSSPRPPPLYI